MTTTLRADPEPDYGTGCLLAAVIAGLLSLLLWAGLWWLGWWLAQRPAVFWLRVGALVLLLLGTALIFAALFRMEPLELHDWSPPPTGRAAAKEVPSVRSTDGTCGAPGRGLGASPTPGHGRRR